MTGVIQVAKSLAAANGTHCIGTTNINLLLSHTRTYFQRAILKQRNSVYSLRGSNKLILPRPRTDILRNSVTYRASTLWNNLKDCTTTVSDFNSFKKLVKEQLKSLTFLPNCGKK